MQVSNEYLSQIENDVVLHGAIRDSIPKLQTLDAVRIEKLVFYLKSIHSFYPRSENHVSFHSEFSDKLDALKASTEQIDYQSRTRAAMFKGSICLIFAGLLIGVALATFLSGQKMMAVGSLVLAIILFVLADSRFFVKAILLSKEQDRRYFLNSIRSARACNELDWAGLFSHNKASKTGPHSDEDLARLNAEVAELTAQLRSALYNDEYFQYSSEYLSHA
jgi:hypothetical protein